MGLKSGDRPVAWNTTPIDDSNAHRVKGYLTKMAGGKLAVARQLLTIGEAGKVIGAGSRPYGRTFSNTPPGRTSCPPLEVEGWGIGRGV